MNMRKTFKRVYGVIDSDGLELTEDLSGQTFGLLTAIRRTTKTAKGSLSTRYWYCECACGGSKVVLNASLKSGYTKSCGCLRKGRKKSIFKPVKEYTREELLEALTYIKEQMNQRNNSTHPNNNN